MTFINYRHIPGAYVNLMKIVPNYVGIIKTNKTGKKFYEACLNGKITTVKKLIPKINFSNIDNTIFLTARNGHIEVVKLLLDYILFSQIEEYISYINKYSNDKEFNNYFEIIKSIYINKK